MTGGPPRVVVVGLGSEYRRDDGAGPRVAEAAAAAAGLESSVGPLADPLDLLGVWDDAELAVVVDATRSGERPGTVQVVDLSEVRHGARSPETPEPMSTHGIGLAGVLRLARSVGHAPRRVVVVGIEAADVGRGQGLSPEVQDAVPHAVQRVVELVGEVATCA